MAQTASISKLSLISDPNLANVRPGEIKAKIKALVDAGEIRLREIERATSYKTSTLSQALSGTYEGDQEKLDDALRRFYRNWALKHAIVKTKVVEQIHNMLYLAWIRHEIGIIIGPFGRGKTKGVTYFTAKNEFSRYVVLSGVTSPGELLHEIGSALGIDSHMTGSSADKLHAIVRSLQREPRLLVIDEADELRPKLIALLRDIHNKSEGACGIVLVGTNKLRTTLRAPDLGYIYSRIGINLTIADIEFAEARRIADLFTHDLDLEDLREAWAWSLERFGTRTLVKLMERSYDMMQQEEAQLITADHIEQAKGLLID